MPITWPVSLPTEPNDGEYQETPPDLVLTTEMECGSPKARRRYTAGVRKLSLPFLFEPEQLAVFDDFLMTTLAGGALSFEFPWPPAPRATQTCTARIVKPLPVYRHVGKGCHKFTLALELLP